MKSLRSLLLIAFIILSLPALAPGKTITAVKDDSGNIILDNISKKDVPKLIDFLGKSGSVSIYSSRALVDLGADAVPELLDALRKGTYPEKIIYILSQIPDKKAAEGLVEIIKDPSAPAVPISALTAYGDLAVPGLVSLLDDKNHGDAAADALGNISPSEESRRIARSCFDSEDPRVRGLAALVLGRWQDSKSAPEIEALLFHNDLKERKNAIIGYSLLYQQAPERYNLDVLERLVMTEKDRDIRRTAVDIIKLIPGKNTDDALLRLIKSEKDNKVLSRLLYSVGDRNDTMMALQALQIIQENDNPDVRAAGFYALGRFRAEEAEPYITTVMHTAKRMNAEMKLQAFEAFVRIGRPVDYKDYLVHMYDADGCEECYSFKDALLDLVEANVKPGDKDTLAFLVSFREKAAPRYIEKVDSIIKKIDRQPN